MKEHKDSVRQRFEKQRRNLIILSILLIAYSALGLEIKTINLFGNVFEISNHEHIKTTLWLFFGWFFVRYYQYYCVIDNKEFSRKYDLWLHKKIKKLAKNKYQNKDIQRRKKENPSAGHFEYAIKSAQVHQKSHDSWEVHICGDITWSSESMKGGQKFQDIIVIPKLELIFSKAEALIKLYFQTPYLTEYAVPFLLSFFAVIIGFTM